MQEQARTKQGGSVVNFLIVGVVLVALALGAIYIAQHRSKTSTAPSAAPSVAVNSGSPVNGSGSGSGSSPAQPSQSPAPSSSPKPSASVQPSPSASATPKPSNAPSSSTGNLPATGPSDDLIISALPIAIMTALAVAYVQSRRAHQRVTSY